MKTTSSAADRRPVDPLFQGADAALRRAAIKAQERRAQFAQDQVKRKPESGSDHHPANKIR